ncbi:glycosyltransferase family 4 protein [Tsuneonella sp. YG55]|uniref:Glycosyltransferase family 4 protein n=1 Tax=Tsuneonella litorea TaxID=2976475 RepID=A0A9X2W3A5_9SPHN|nr:glycosyltransferase family 4 protein [Tsuneonella litorea]MCT2559828.1 glycosyltransferase family 4 protein [Tsuneonella litorea]
MSAGQTAPPRILHLHSTFASGGKERRAVRLMNAFGPKVQHAIVSAVPGETSAAKEIGRALAVSWPTDFPALQGRPTPGRLKRLAEAMRGYDLVLTYNWGAMDAVMANTLFGEAFGLPPLIHHEDGFNEDEQQRLKPARNWYRRIALGRAKGLVVPSETLEEIALTTWAQPIGRVRRIPNGIDTEAFAKPPKPDALPGLIKRPGEFWVGTLAGLRPVKNLPALVRAVAPLPEFCQLVIVGEGPERETIRAEAERLGVEHRVHLAGFAHAPERFVGLFDLFALSSHSEQFPISLVEAMAAGRPVAAYDVGDVAEMVSDANRPLIVPRGDEDALSRAIGGLLYDTEGRAALRKANKAKARREFDEKTMIAAYRRLYASAMGRTGLP